MAPLPACCEERLVKRRKHWVHIGGFLTVMTTEIAKHCSRPPRGVT